MGEKIYYPAVFFTDIVKYYGGSETYIEEQMHNNIANMKALTLSKLKDSLEDLQRINEEVPHENRMGWGILEDLRKIKVSEKEQKKISKIITITNKLKSMSQIDGEISDNLLLKIQQLSEKSGKTGYSDSNILRFMDSNLNALGEEKYNDIINYLIEPKEQNDYCALTKWLQECIHESRYNGIPTVQLEQIERYLTRSDFSSKHILRIFRILEQCSVGFSKKDNSNDQDKSNFEIQKYWRITENIIKALQNIWGEIEVEGIGITQEEKSEISLDVCQELLKDYTFYQRSVSYDIETSKGFQALIFYRLYNKIFYYMGKKDDSSEEAKDMQKALAFFAFSILQRAIEHTEVLLHPAAQIDSPVYIGERVMVGKQCKIEAECVLGNNVCLYPFNIYNREIHDQDMYIYVGEKTAFCKDTKVLGSIRIGKECIINKSILIGDSIEDKRYVGKNSIVECDNKMRLEKKAEIMEGKL